MYILVNTMYPKPEKRDEFLQAITEDAQACLSNERGCLRFDVMRDNEDPDQFHLTEVYRDQAAFEEHLRTPHLQRYREVSKDLMAQPSIVRRCTNVYPPDDSG